MCLMFVWPHPLFRGYSRIQFPPWIGATTIQGEDWELEGFDKADRCSRYCHGPEIVATLS